MDRMILKMLFIAIACLTGCSVAEPLPKAPEAYIAPATARQETTTPPAPESEEWRLVVGTRDRKNYDPNCTFTIGDEPTVYRLWFIARMDAEERGLPSSTVIRHCPLTGNASQPLGWEA